MPNTKYRCAPEYRADMLCYLQQIEDTEGVQERSRLLTNLTRCLREDVSPRQRTVLLLYFVKQMSQPEIAVLLGINKSTVCRTIKRGEERLRRCLRYGAQRYLMSMDETNTRKELDT